MLYVRGLATGADCAEFRDVLAMSRKVFWFTDIDGLRNVVICGFARQGFPWLVGLVDTESRGSIHTNEVCTYISVCTYVTASRTIAA